MEQDWLILEKADDIAVLTLNRPRQLNSFPAPMFGAMAQMLNAVSRDSSVRALIITGAGRAFCAGLDVSTGLPEVKQMSRQELGRLMHSFTFALHDVPQPTIAAINGIAVGAGLAIALLCDMRIASEEAKFASGYLGMGVTPDIGSTYSWPRIAGSARAMELLLTGDTFDAATACRIGLLNRVVPAAEVLPAARALAQKIARGPTVAIGLTKQALKKSPGNSLEQQVAVECSAFYDCLKTVDHQEALDAFLAKRPPDFKGR